MHKAFIWLTHTLYNGSASHAEVEFAHFAVDYLSKHRWETQAMDNVAAAYELFESKKAAGDKKAAREAISKLQRDSIS